MASVANVRRLGVFIAPTANTRPVEADYDPTTIVVQWGVMAGSRLWQATFVSDLGAQARRLVDVTILPGATRQVEIWEIDPDDEEDIRQTPLFWGELVQSQIAVGSGGEREMLVARMEPYHFGNVIAGQTVYGSDEEDYVVNIPLEFNPMVDGAIIPNRWKVTGNADWWYRWIDPESTRSGPSLKYQDFGSDPEEPEEHAVNESWDVRTIVETLCEIANADEDLIDNVQHGNYDAMIPEDTPEVRNLVLKTGAYLPDYLDVVTQRHGYNWTVDCHIDRDDANAMKPILRFFKQMDGVEKTVKMQDVAAVLSIEGTDTSNLQLSCDIGLLANKITGNGALIEREMTIPLVRSWDEDDDGTEDHEDVHNPIGRKWVANEAGDYIGKRAEITEPTVFGADWQVKRRVIEDCLTLRDGTRRPPYLEYRDSEGGEIKPVPTEWGWKILPNEIGIYFTGQREPDSDSGGIPLEVLTTDVELFITGTVRGDTRPTFSTEVSVGSPNVHTIERVIDLSDRFFDRARMTGPYASTLTGDAFTADDQAALEEYVEKVRAESDLADMQATITLFGLHFDDEYAVGDILTKLEGREISFNRAASGGAPAYVQIVGITHNNQVGNQSTVLTVSPHGVLA